MPRKKTIKKTKVKQKTSVSQQVNVYVTKRGGGGAKRPPQPSQAVQLLQTIAPLLSQKQPLVPSAQPLLSSQQQLESLVNLLSQRQPNIIVNAPQGEKGEKGDTGRQGARGFPAPMPEVKISSPLPEVSLEDVRRVARGIVPPSERSGVSSWQTPSLESLSPRSLPSFAFDFENASMKSGRISEGDLAIPRSGTGQSYVLDLPDAPLVQPAQPAVSGAPIRLDNPHEDAPIDEKKEEAVSRLKVPRPRPAEQYLSQYEIPNIMDITEQYVQSLSNTAQPKTNKVTLRQLANAYGIQLSRADLKNKTTLSTAIWNNIQQRKQNPNLPSSLPK